ncbi:MAG TPA: wax ester/triacylglycerol synthase family O-acyltransferase [Mycobacterium sp.]|nr:wax ester/triacylglycerol synthase family O-acyltransferase [Mycobacterium sp.]
MKRFARPEAVAFLSLESSERPMHFSALQLFRPPRGSGPDFARNTYEAMRAHRDVTPAYAGHPATSRRGTSRLRWTYDDDVDIDYHLRYTTVRPPGGMRELLALGDELHAPPLDRRKPLWECHVIDGLNDGRFAILYKVHHALMDGMSWANQMHAALSTDPDDSRIRVGWTRQPECHQPVAQARARRVGRAGPAKFVADLRRSSSLMMAAMREPQLIPAFRARRTILNVGSSATVRRAWQSWPIKRIQDVANAAAVTVNDVGLAMSAGALRELLAERDALPDVPLVAMVPVDLRNEQDVDANNILGIALCNLATNVDDPDERLRVIHASMQYNKQIIRELPRQLAIHLGGLICAPISGSSGLRAKIPPMFNVYISSMRGKTQPLYRNGARLEAAYGWAPMLPEQALMFGTHTDAEKLEFGITACSRVVPDPARLLGQLETSLKDLERAVGL